MFFSHFLLLLQNHFLLISLLIPFRYYKWFKMLKLNETKTLKLGDGEFQNDSEQNSESDDSKDNPDDDEVTGTTGQSSRILLRVFRVVIRPAVLRVPGRQVRRSSVFSDNDASRRPHARMMMMHHRTVGNLRKVKRSVKRLWIDVRSAGGGRGVSVGVSAVGDFRDGSCSSDGRRAGDDWRRNGGRAHRESGVVSHAVQRGQWHCCVL